MLVKRANDSKFTDGIIISHQMQTSIFHAVSAVLWFGNLEFEDLDGEEIRLSDSDKSVLDK